MVPTAFMRQLDYVCMEHLTPSDFLINTATIYGTSIERREFVFGLIRPLFPVETAKNEKGEEVVILDPFNTAPVVQLSGGQRKMLAIAASLFNETQLLLLDEPLSGLDSAACEKVISLLRTVAETQGTTIIMILHQPSDEILLSMDKIVCLAKGRVIFDEQIKDFNLEAMAPAEYVHNVLVNQGVKEGPKSEPVEGRSTLSSLSMSCYLSSVQRSALQSLVVNESSIFVGSEQESEIAEGNQDSSEGSKHDTSHKSSFSFSASLLPRYELPLRTIISEARADSKRIGQILPILRRIHLEHGLPIRDFLLFPAG